MKHLVVSGDFVEGALLFSRLADNNSKDNDGDDDTKNKPTLVILSGFPCLVQHDPPTETDGPNGALALAWCGVSLGYKVVIVTDDCNADVFQKGLDALLACCQGDMMTLAKHEIVLRSFPEESKLSSDQDEELMTLSKADLIIACERAGPASDGKCYTMRGIDMNEHGLIAPLHRIVEMARRNNNGGGAKFIGIGDGGNELGMGKVIDAVHKHIPLGEKIGCTMSADYLIAASVSNWGAYALCGAAALVRAYDSGMVSSSNDNDLKEWVDKCVVTPETDLHVLKECMKAGCRDGINQRLDEPYVDGMPAERSLECLKDIRDVCLERET